MFNPFKITPSPKKAEPKALLSPKEEWEKEVHRLKIKALKENDFTIETRIKSKQKEEYCSYIYRNYLQYTYYITIIIIYNNEEIWIDKEKLEGRLTEGFREGSEHLLINGKLMRTTGLDIPKDIFIDKWLNLSLEAGKKLAEAEKQKEKVKKEKQEQQKKKEEDAFYTEKLAKLRNLAPLDKNIEKSIDNFEEINRLTKENEDLLTSLEKNLTLITKLWKN